MRLELDTAGTRLDSEIIAALRSSADLARKIEASFRDSQDAGRTIDASIRSAQDAGRKIEAAFRDSQDAGRTIDASIRSAQDAGRKIEAAFRPGSAFNAAVTASSKAAEATAVLTASRATEAMSQWKDHLKSLLRRLGVPVNLDEDEQLWFRLWAAIRPMSIPDEELRHLSLFEVAGLLEQEVWKLERLAAIMDRTYAPAPAVGRPPKSRKTGGRPCGTPVNGEHLRELRGKLTQADLAEKCGLKVHTIQRGESGKGWDRETYRMAAKGLTETCGRKVSIEELKNIPAITAKT